MNGSGGGLVALAADERLGLADDDGAGTSNDTPPAVAAGAVILDGASPRNTIALNPAPTVPDLTGAPFALRQHSTLDSIADQVAKMGIKHVRGDIIGDAPVERYTETLKALLAEPDTGAVHFMHAPTAIVRSEDIARACAPLVRQAPGRVMACWLGGAAVLNARRILEDAGMWKPGENRVKKKAALIR